MRQRERERHSACHVSHNNKGQGFSALPFNPVIPAKTYALTFLLKP